MTELTLADMRTSVREHRVQMVSSFGFTERQARFLVHVLVYSGVFLERQYRAFAGIAHGQKTQNFLAKLVAGRYATAITPGALHRGRIFHVQYKPLYEAIGEENNRHRKPASLGRLVERLMILDAVLADTRYTWLGTENDKLQHFICGVLRSDFKKADYPHLTFGDGDDKTVRYFPDKLPIGAERNFGRRHVFLYLVTRDVPIEFRAFLHRHAELLRSLPEWTIRLLIPRHFRKAANLYRYAIRDELATPLSPHAVEELEWFFPALQEAPGTTPPPRGLDLATAREKYSAARYQALHRAWQREGLKVLLMARSPVLQDRLREGRGRIEFVELPHQYLQLSSLVGVS
jgi:hypothetical protein